MSAAQMAAIRGFDIAIATAGLLAAAPFLLAGAIGIVLSSPGPILYRARRVGRHGTEFDMYKLRTMHVRTDSGPAITSFRDIRVFRFGSLLRLLKIDEFPQFFNILRGDMSVIGPRPEDPAIVRDAYSTAALETLSVRPGLTSPGSVFYYTHLEPLLDESDPTTVYKSWVLPVKLALDLVYVRNVSLSYNIRLMGRTGVAILARALGKTYFADPPELRLAAEADMLPDALPGKLKGSLS